MTFNNYRNQEPILAEGIKEIDFINAINSYTSIDDALLRLDDEYIEWYMMNMNSKKVKNLLKRLNISGLHEDTQNTQTTLGYAPSADRITKSIKYKGQFITVEYDRELGSWFPAIRFRSIISALKYIKAEVDFDEKNI